MTQKDYMMSLLAENPVADGRAIAKQPAVSCVTFNSFKANF